MGWKNVKEHFRIGHIVAIHDGTLCIGSPYVYDLITISPDGEVEPGKLGLSGNDDLARYFKEMTEDRAKLVELIASPDSFEKSLPVYTYNGGQVIEKRCEAYGWPNVTHDGCLMYDNSFSADKNKVAKWAKCNASAEGDFWKRRVDELKADVAKAEMRLSESQSDFAKLHAEFPEHAP